MKTFWQHTNGMIYVVESDSFGRVTGGAGPFYPGELRDPSEYTCGAGVLGWLKRAIAERKVQRINPEIPKDAPPSPAPGLWPRGSRQEIPAGEQTPVPAAGLCPRGSRQKISAAHPTPPPHPRVIPVPARPHPECEPDDGQREKENRQRFAWASAYHL